MLGKVVKFFCGVCDNIIGLCMLLATAFVLVLNLFYTSSVAYVWTEDVSITKASWVPIVFVPVLFVLFFFLQKFLVKVEEKYLFAVLSVCYLAAGLYWVFNISPELRFDAYSVHEAAVLFLKGDYSYFMYGEYLYQNEHQLGIVTYEALLGLISTDVRFQYFVNLLEIIGINFVSWRLSDMCFGHNHKTNLFVILITFLFLPQFFFLAFAYGIIPGLFFLLCAFWFQQCYFKTRKKCFVVLCVLFTTLAAAVKGNNIIGAIAIAILFFLQMLKEKKIRHLLFALLVMLCAGMIGDAITSFYEWKTGMELSGGKPMLLYIVMGTEPNNQANAPGWFNGYNDWAFSEAGYDPEKAKEIAKNTLKDTIYTYHDHPDWMISFFTGKLESIWCDQLYESLWSGPLPDVDFLSNTQFLNDMYSGKSAEPYVACFMKAFMILMFALAVLSACSRQNQKQDCNYLYLYFVGGFLLHILWEAKSQYVYPYVFVMLPCCAHELSVLCDKLEVFLAKRREAQAVK